VVAVEAKVPGDEPAELHDDADLHRAAGDAGWATWRHECGLAKVDPAVALMEAELAGDPDRKVILVAHHLDVIEGLRTGLHAYGATTIVGSLSQLERARRVERFQVDPACRVIVLQLHAGGTAITLTAAQDVVFVEASTVPGDNAQVADRAHRIGQQGSVLCRYLSVAGSADEAVARILARKTEALRSIGLGGGA
jgi:SWI/SNF-related matrix-associated actin-dependent regulator 1 of chromatin subfamily A